MNELRLQAGDLMAYLDGEVEPVKRQQIAADPRSREQVQLLQETERELTSKLVAIIPPSPLELGEYQLGLLTADRAQEIALYLKLHPHAARQLEVLEDFLADPEPVASPKAPRLRERVRVLVAALLSDAPGGLQPALGVRGELEWVYQAGDLQIVLQIDLDPNSLDQRIVSGMVLGLESAGITVRLLRSDEPAERATVTADPLGNFVFARVRPHTYQLILSSNDPPIEIHLPLLNVT